MTTDERKLLIAVAVAIEAMMRDGNSHVSELRDVTIALNAVYGATS